MAEPERKPIPSPRNREIQTISWVDCLREKECGITLGNFDGVHVGHSRILGTLGEFCKKRGLEPVVITFLPHPGHFFRGKEGLPLVTAPWEKEYLIRREFGFRTLFVEFDREFSSLSPEQFIQHFLIEKLKAKVVVLGPDYRFGAGANGNLEMLKKGIDDYADVLEIVPSVKIEGRVVSSSLIRDLLLKGDIKRAANMLGRSFFYSGTVVKGAGRGKGLGFPTANLEVHCREKIIAASGVYGARAQVAGKIHHALVNIGSIPTFQAEKTSIEAHILDLKRDICGQNLALELNSYLRKEKKFKSAEELISKIQTDINNYRRELEEQGDCP